MRLFLHILRSVLFIKCAILGTSPNIPVPKYSLIALYEENKMTAIASYDAFRHDASTPFEITADSNKEYKIKAFFWNFNTQTPYISFIESAVKTSE